MNDIQSTKKDVQPINIDDDIKSYNIQINNINLHVTEIGEGPAVLFCHGFPDTAYTWRKQMKAVAKEGYRAIAPDMRGYGNSSAPEDPNLYTPFHTVGDMIGLIDELNIPTAAIVGHDWGANHAWFAALIRPDRFNSVFSLSVPYFPRDKVNFLDSLRKAGFEDKFYMFEHIKPEADQTWSKADTTIPGALYWASATPPDTQRWSPLDPTRSLHRAVQTTLPSWIDENYLKHNIDTFNRTGFRGGLNYYRAINHSFHLSAAFNNAAILQPSFFIWGKADGLTEIFDKEMKDKFPSNLPGFVKNVALDNAGHWVQHEAAETVNTHLVSFLNQISQAKIQNKICRYNQYYSIC